MAGKTKTRNVMSQSTSLAEERADSFSAWGASCRDVQLKADEVAYHTQVLAVTSSQCACLLGFWHIINAPISPGDCRALQLVQACLDTQLDLHAASYGCWRLKAF